jgi:hypothetical protein
LKIACFILKRTGFILMFSWWEFLCSGGINGSKSTKFHANCQTKCFFFFCIMLKTYFKSVRNVRWIFVKFSLKRFYDVHHMHQTTRSTESGSCVNMYM